MTRKPKYWTYWILAFSLNLIPLAAQGEEPGYIDFSVEEATTKKPAQSNGGPKALPALAKPTVAKAPVAKKPLSKKRKFNPKAKIDWNADPLTPDGTISVTPTCDDAKNGDLYESDKKHKRNKAKTNVVHICEQTEWQKTHKTKRPPPAKATAPEFKTAPEVAATPAGPSRDLSLSELDKLVKNLEHKVEGGVKGDNVDGSVNLRGRIFVKCASELKITRMGKTLSKDPSCANNVAGFRFQDLGGFESCQKPRMDKKVKCTNVKGDENECVYLGDIPELRETSLPLENLPGGEIHIVRENLDGNEDHAQICDQFPTRIIHKTDAEIRAREQGIKAAAHEARIAESLRQVSSCTHTAEELSIAKSACEWLKHAGQFATVEECMKNLDKKEIEILKNQAKLGSPDDLDRVTDSVIAWAKSHPAECSKAVDVLQEIGIRHVKRRGVRNSDVTPYDGYNTAVEAYERAFEDVPCLSEEPRFIVMQNNMEANRALKACEVGGVCSVECQALALDVQQKATLILNEFCRGGGWDVKDRTCSAATNNFQGAVTIQMRAQAERNRESQATQQLWAMAMQSQQSQGGAGGQYLGGGASTFQVPGPNGAPGAGVYSGTSSGSFTMPGSPGLIGSTRPGGSSLSGGFGFGGIN